MPSTATAPVRKQCNVRLPPAMIRRADEKRAQLGLSRDRYIEQLIAADTTPEPTAEELAEAEALAARIRGEG